MTRLESTLLAVLSVDRRGSARKRPSRRVWETSPAATSRRAVLLNHDQPSSRRSAWSISGATGQAQGMSKCWDQAGVTFGSQKGTTSLAAGCCGGGSVAADSSLGRFAGCRGGSVGGGDFSIDAAVVVVVWDETLAAEDEACYHAYMGDSLSSILDERQPPLAKRGTAKTLWYERTGVVFSSQPLLRHLLPVRRQHLPPGPRSLHRPGQEPADLPDHHPQLSLRLWAPMLRSY